MKRLLSIIHYPLSILLLLITYYLLLITPVLAQEDGQPLGPIQGIPGAYLPDPKAEGIESAGTMFSTIFSNIITFLSIVGALMFLLYFIIGALNWISAGGKPEKVENAKNTMTNAAIGLIVIVAAYSVIYIISRVLGIPILEPEKYIPLLGPGGGNGTETTRQIIHQEQGPGTAAGP